MDTKWMWKAKSSETAQIRLKRNFCVKSGRMHFCVDQEMLFFLCWQSLYFLR